MNIGFLGLGSMGLPISKKIISACKGNYFFYARKENVIKEMSEAGLEFICTFSKLGDVCDIIFLFLENGVQYDECVLGDSGILSGMKDGIIVISSTIGEKKIKEIELACRCRNIQLLDAPMSGGVKKAMNGELTYIISGSTDAFEQVEPLITSCADNIYYVGADVGKAQKIKLLNQMLVGIHMVATAEVFHMGASMNLDLNLLYEILIHSAGSSNIFENRGKTMIDRDFSTRSTIHIMKKDMKLSVELAHEYSQMMYLNKLCADLFEEASKVLPLTEDASAIIKLYENQKI